MMDIIKLISDGKISSREAVEASLAAAEKAVGDIFITAADRNICLAEAEASDKRRSSGEALSPLDGVPVAVKDNIMTAGMRTTCGSKMLENFVPPYDATVISRLRAAGCIIIGKTNMDEFGMGSTTENSAFFVTHNPINPEYVPGGSSGGSAASVAAGITPFALGSDTGGSVRQPAAFCGIVGLKPTYGAVSRYGLTAFASSLDVIGPMADSVKTCAAFVSVIYGKDAHDVTSIDVNLSDRRIPSSFAVPDELITHADDETQSVIESAAAALTDIGLRRISVSLPSLKSALPAYYIISSAEASSNLARFDGIRYGRRADGEFSVDELISASRGEYLGDEVKRRILIGTYALSEGVRGDWYGRAMTARKMISDEMRSALTDDTIMLCPVSPAPPWRIGETPVSAAERYAADIMTVPASLAGLPALSMPWGRAKSGLPIGIQLIAGAGRDGSLLALGERLEDCRG